jgi:hypothetical protein
VALLDGLKRHHDPACDVGKMIGLAIDDQAAVDKRIDVELRD